MLISRFCFFPLGFSLCYPDSKIIVVDLISGVGDSPSYIKGLNIRWVELLS